MACESLPDSVWHHVMRYLSREEGGRFGTVSHECQSIVDGLYRLFSIFNTNTVPYMSGSNIMLLFKRWLQVRPKIETLLFEHRDDIQDVDFGEEEDHDSDVFTSLRKMSIVKCPGIHGHLLNRISHHCSNLKVLNLCGSRNIDPLSIIAVVRTAGAKLRSLSLEDLNAVNDAVLEELGRSCPRIVVCNLRGCVSITDDGLHALVTGCTRIMVLDISSCSSLSEGAIPVIANNCTKLLKLNVIGCRDTVVNTSKLNYLALCCRPELNLKYIRVDYCNKLISSETLAHLMDRFSEMRGFGLGFINGVNDTILQHAGNRLKDLQLLGMNRCEEVTDVGVAALVQGCPNLSVLDIGGCPSVTFRTLDMLAKHRPNIQRLSLQRSKHILCHDLETYLVQFTEITELTLCGCDVTDETIDILARTLKHITFIDISECELLTDDCMISLATHLGQQLIWVNIQDTNITAQHFSTFGAQCTISASSATYAQIVRNS